MKATGLVSSLSKRILQEVETRWNSVHTMLASVLDMYDEVRSANAPHPRPCSTAGLTVLVLSLPCTSTSAPAAPRRAPIPPIRRRHPPSPPRLHERAVLRHVIN